MIKDDFLNLLDKFYPKYKIRFFRYGVGNSWELNFVGKKYNLRIAIHQFALWKNYEPIFNYSF